MKIKNNVEKYLDAIDFLVNNFSLLVGVKAMRYQSLTILLSVFVSKRRMITINF